MKAGPSATPRCAPESVGDDGAAVTSIVQAVAEEEGLTSAVFRVTRGGDVVAAGAVGETVEGVPADQTMSFRVGNVAFAYIGTLALLLAEEGLVDLNDPISTFLPDLEVPNADDVTLEMLLRNTSGYADHVRSDDFVDEYLANPFASFSPDELIELGMATPPWYEPGTAWNYSHTAQIIAAQMLEAATGEDLATLLRERVIDPMDLDDTAPTLTPELPEPALHSYSTEREVFEDTTYWNPSWQTAPGSVVTSNICDLARSAEAIGSGALLQEESYEELLAPVTVELEPAPETCPDNVCREQTEDAYYGLGVRVSGGWVAQAPSFGGAGGVHAYLPQDELAVAIQAVGGPESASGNPAQEIWERIADDLTPDHPV